MNRLQRLGRLWRTVRHLKPGQIVGRAHFLWHRPRVELHSAPPLRPSCGLWVRPAAREANLTGPTRLRFLSAERSLDDCGWDKPEVERLWRYNLHYFDDLNADSAECRRDWQRALLARWLAENPPPKGTAWEPYPVSLRIVNWVKWALVGGDLGEQATQSLAVQARWLARRLEWHLLGNHLFVNAKALVFAGSFFDGPEAARWRAEGSRILRRQLAEQILPDGGQFERSPMYHALALEDVLDLINVLAASGASADSLGEALRPQVKPMRRWLQAMTHPDGEIAFFNDAAMGIAPRAEELDAYAGRLGFPGRSEPLPELTVLADSGFVRMQRGPAVVIADVGPVGPDYLPGHAHADTLSFELSLHGRRLIVNSGTSEYGVGAERLRQRGTAAHSTVSVDGQDSSEVWGGFRVARRARPYGGFARVVEGRIEVGCRHDGYRRLPGRPVHARRWMLDAHGLDVEDEVSHAPGRACMHVHWAPGVHCLPDGSVMFEDARAAQLELHGTSRREVASTWHPRFGEVVSNESTVARITGTSCILRLRWT
jgi:uncharacterized heparinase superfamily protein